MSNKRNLKQNKNPQKEQYLFGASDLVVSDWKRRDVSEVAGY